MRRRTFLAGLAGTATAAGAVGEGAASTTPLQRQQGGKTHTIGMHTKDGGYYFDPVGLYVKPGDTVKWVIKSGSHSTTAYTKSNPQSSTTRIPKGAKGWNSGVIDSGSFSYTFKKKGTYDYYCIPHKSLGMVGRIVCGAPGGPAEQSEIPDDVGGGTVPDSKTIVQKKSLSYPYVPGTSHGGPPLLFWGGAGIFATTSVYLYSVYDRATGRYEENTPDDETGV
jgi:plastocyanin